MRKTKRIKFIDSSIMNEQTDKLTTPFLIEAIGFVVAETSEYITLAMEVMDNGDVRHQISIPKVAIKR